MHDIEQIGNNLNPLKSVLDKRNEVQKQKKDGFFLCIVRLKLPNASLR